MKNSICKFMAFAIFGLLVFSKPCQAQTVDTIAGDGPFYPVGSKVLSDLAVHGAFAAASKIEAATTYPGAAQVSIPTPAGIALDSNGNLYFSDWNYGVYELFAAIQVGEPQVQFVAGNGSYGYSGDNGPAIGAQLDTPWGIALDSSGNLFIADYNNCVVREVIASSGLIQTVAGNNALGCGYSGDGGPATSATLNYPSGVAVDSHGNLFIADYVNDVIREFTASDSKIKTIAGTGSYGYTGDNNPAINARLNWPEAICVDTAGNLYIADSGNHVVREVVIATGNIKTVAGNGTAGNSGDEGQAVNAELNLPSAVFVDASGQIYIADSAAEVIRIVDQFGDIHTLTSLSSDSLNGITVDTDGTALVTEGTSHLVVAYDPVAHEVTTIAGNGYQSYSGDGGDAFDAQLLSPAALAVDNHNSVFVADTGNNLIRELTPDTEQVSGLAINLVAGEPHVIGCCGNGGPAIGSSLVAPTGVAVDSAGNFYFPDANHDVVLKVSATDQTINVFAGNPDASSGYSGDGGPATDALMSSPERVAVDNAGNLFIADSGNCVIREVVKSTGYIQTVAGNYALGCGFGGDGGAATSAQLDEPGGMAFDSNQNLFIADNVNQVIREVVASTGKIQTVAGTPGTTGYAGDGGPAVAAELNTPVAVHVDSAGNLLIADYYNCVIRRVDANGLIATLAGSGTCGFAGDGGPAMSAEFMHISDVTTDPSNNVLVADTYNNRIRVIQAPATLTTSFVDLTSSLNPAPINTPVTFTAQVGLAALVKDVKTAAGTDSSSGNPPRGMVTFKDGSTVLSTETIDASGAASWSTSGLAAGSHTITASFSGDAWNAASTSSVLSQTVQPAGTANTQTALVSSANSITWGKSVSFTATVTTSGSNPPTGTVNFMEGSTKLGSGKLNSSRVATFATTQLAVGQHSIIAQYGGDANNNTSASAPVTVTVAQATTITALTASANPATVGDSITFTATVTSSSGTVPTRSVTFNDGSSALGPGTLNSSGVATYSTSSLAAGSHSITAVYSGDANNAVSTSAALNETVNPATVTSPDFSLASAPASLSLAPGGSASATVTVTPVNSFSQAVSFACSNLPAGVTCSFAPSTVTPAGAAAKTTVTIAASAQAALRSGGTWLLTGCPFLALCLWTGGKRPRRRLGAMLAVVLAAGAITALAGCGSSSSKKQPVTSVVTVTATAGTLHHTTTITVTVQP
jgi:hypothetical protein